MTHPRARNWAALLLMAALSLLLLACADAPAADNARLDALAADNARLESTIAAMQAAQSAAAATPTPRPTVTPTPETGNICYRTPEVQQAILYTLGIEACQVVTPAELFRLRKLSGIHADAFKPGDFADLPNLYQLVISTDTLPEPAVFDGLTGLVGLTLTIPTDSPPLALPSAMFATLPHLEQLSLSCSCHMAADTLDGLPALEWLYVEYVIAYTPHALDNLVSLQHLTWLIEGDYNREPDMVSKFPRDWLAQLPELQGFKIGYHGFADSLPPIIELGSLKAAASFFIGDGGDYLDSVTVFVGDEKVDYLERVEMEQDGSYITNSLLLIGERTFDAWQLLDE